MLITNFSSGELSKYLSGRVDLPQYYQGAKKLCNFEPVPTGGLCRRSGFKRMGKLSEACRIIPFIINADYSYILEFVPEKLYFWENGLRKENEEGPVFIPTPWKSLDEIRQIQYAQDFDTMVFVQRNRKPFELKYNFDTKTFSGAEMEFDIWPDVELDDDYSTDEKTIVKIVDTDNLPEADFDGQYCIFEGALYKWSAEKDEWELQGKDPETDRKLFSEEGKFPGAVAFYNSRLWFASTEEKRQKVWASATPDTKGTRYNVFPSYKKYVTVSKVIKDPDMHIFTGSIKLNDAGSDTEGCLITDVTQDFTKDNVLKEDVTLYFCNDSTGSYIQSQTKVLEITSNTIRLDRKALGIKEDTTGIVFTISLWQNSATASADDYEYKVNQANAVTSDCSFSFELASDQNDSVKWLCAGKYMTVGTESSVWAVPAGISALSIAVEMSGRYGSDDIQAHCVGTASIFLSQGKCGIREYYYDNDSQAFLTNNIALIASQMLEESPAIDFDFLTNPYNRLLVTRQDGIIACMLYDKTNGIMAWYRIVHGEGLIESVSVTRGIAETDYIYAVVNYDGERYLELLDPSDHVFLDSWMPYDEEKKSEYRNNAVIYNATEKKIYSFDEEFKAKATDILLMGYLYRSEVESMPVIAKDATGKKRITNLIVRFLDSWMPEMKCGENTEYFTDVEKPFSGLKNIDYPGTSERDVTFTFTTEECEQVTILSVDANIA